MAQTDGQQEPAGARLGEGEFPPQLERVNFGAFLLAVVWAPFHRLWGWFAVFVVLEMLESAMGLSSPRFLGGVLRQPVAMVAFRVVYWIVTVVFALRANRLVWAEERHRMTQAEGSSSTKPPSLVSRYNSNEHIWALVGLVLLAATPLSLLVGPFRSNPETVTDLVVTVGTQTILLIGLFAYDRVLVARRQAPTG